MKKYVNTCLLAVVALVLCLLVFPTKANAASVDDLEFTMHYEGIQYHITGCDKDASGDLVIPETYKGLPVAWINYEAFANCDKLTSIIIPDSVTEIGTFAFSRCDSLKSVIIGDGVERVEYNAFSGCTSLTDITFGSSVTTIAECAFTGCASLESITIPDHITHIEEGAFKNCSALKTIDFGNGVTDIGRHAFYYCTALTSVTLPDNVVNLGDGVFSYCSKLERANVGNGISIIHAGTFSNCTSLSDVKIGSGVKTIEYYAFLNCSNMKNLVLPDTVTYIDDNAFHYDPVESVPANVTVWYLGTEEQKNSINIGYGNSNLTNATWHYNVSMTQEGNKQIYTCGDCGETYEFTIAEMPKEELPEVEFADVSVTGWQFKAVSYVYAKNLMAGKGKDAEGRIKFDPNNHITREEFVQVLYNAEGKPSVEGVVNRFPDVKNDWYKNAVLWANSMNIASGMGNGNFGVGKSITRQDLAVMLYKYAAMKIFNTSANAGEINRYADGSMVSGYAKTAMDWAVTNGIMSGKGTAGEPISSFRLDPTGTATRAECAAMLKNFMENIWVDEKQ